MNKPMADFQECSNTLDNIHEQILGLEIDLQKAFLQTFD
jgi:hypothetical protein